MDRHLNISAMFVDASSSVFDGYEFPSPSRARSHAASLEPTAPSGSGATCYGARPCSHMAHRACSPPSANLLSWEGPHFQDRRRSDCGDSVRRAMTWPNLSFAQQQQLTGPHRPLPDTDAAAVSGGGCSHLPATPPGLTSQHGGGGGCPGRISEGGGVGSGGGCGGEGGGGGGGGGGSDGGGEMDSDGEQLRSGPQSAGVQGAAAGGDSGGDGAAAGRRRRSTLCREQAMAIYVMRAADDGGDGAAGRSGCSADAVARQFGVTSKTIRDIWKGRTWFRDTFLLDAGGRAALLTDRFARRPGRPKGSKDTKPRRPKRRLHSPPPDSAPSHAQAPPAAYPTHAAGSAAGGYGGAGGAGGWGLPVVSPAVRAVDMPCAPAPPAEACAGDGGRAEEITAAAGGLGEAESELADPFHHDWAYWPK